MDNVRDLEKLYRPDERVVIELCHVPIFEGTFQEARPYLEDLAFDEDARLVTPPFRAEPALDTTAREMEGQRTW